MMRIDTNGIVDIESFYSVFAVAFGSHLSMAGTWTLGSIVFPTWMIRALA